MINTNHIRNQLIRIARETSDKKLQKRIEHLSDDVMELCDAYDDVNSLEAVVKLGNDSLNQSFEMIENLRKSL